MKRTKIILASASPRRRELLAQIGLDFEVKVSNVEEKATAAEPGAMVEELSGQKAEAVLREIQSRIWEGEENAYRGDVLIIGADTAVSIDGRILGKPADETEAAQMLGLLSGRCHEVYTGVTLLYWTWGGGAGEEENRAEGSPEEEAGEDGSAKKEAGVEGSPKEKAESEGCLEKEGRAEEGRAEEKTGKESKGEEFNAGIRQVLRRTFHERTKVSFYPMTKEEISFYAASGDCMDKAGAYGIQGLCARYIKGVEGDYNNVVGLPVGRLYQEIKDWIDEKREESSHI